MKKFLAVLGITTCLLGLTACNNTQNPTFTKQFPYDVASVEQSVMDSLNELSSYTDMELLELESNLDDKALIDWVDGWKQTNDDAGGIIGYDQWNVVYNDDGSLDLSCIILCDKHDVDFKIIYKYDASIDYTTFAVRYSFAEKMTKAGLNTVIGISLVFVVLILISFIISLFKYISVIEKNLKAKKEANQPKVDNSVDNTISQIAEKEEAEEDLTDDLELVAVIAAAIAASEGTTPDGLVVRSIRKVNRSRR